MLYNQSTPGKLKFALVEDTSVAGTPKSKRIGDDSFKGMGVDFGDPNHDGLYDVFVSNLTVRWGIVESNFHYINTAKDQADLRTQLRTARRRSTNAAARTAPRGRAGAGT